DGVGQRGWAIWGGVGTAHVAVFEFKEPIGFAKGSAITCRLEHDYPGNPDPHPIGRFRISVTTRKPPLSLENAMNTPETVRVAFSDDFEAGAGKWTVTQGTFTVVSSDGSRRYQTTHTPKDDIFRSTAGDTSWGDYTIEAKIKFNDSLADGGG